MPQLPLQLIVGLGNPGPEHALTRHNAGFWFVDVLAREYGGSFREQRRFQGDSARIRIGERELTLFKPMTFMNRSGGAVRSFIDYFNVPAEQVLVVHDEIDLPVGTVRLKYAGGPGGHNGVRDVIAHLGENFWRLRLGVGHPGSSPEVIDYVLKRASAAEEDIIMQCVGEAAALMPYLLEEGAEKAMHRLHTKPKNETDEDE